MRTGCIYHLPTREVPVHGWALGAGGRKAARVSGCSLEKVNEDWKVNITGPPLSGEGQKRRKSEATGFLDFAFHG